MGTYTSLLISSVPVCWWTTQAVVHSSLVGSQYPYMPGKFTVSTHEEGRGGRRRGRGNEKKEKERKSTLTENMPPLKSLRAVRMVSSSLKMARQFESSTHCNLYCPPYATLNMLKLERKRKGERKKEIQRGRW